MIFNNGKNADLANTRLIKDATEIERVREINTSGTYIKESSEKLYNYG